MTDQTIAEQADDRYREVVIDLSDKLAEAAELTARSVYAPDAFEAALEAVKEARHLAGIAEGRAATLLDVRREGEKAGES